MESKNQFGTTALSTALVCAARGGHQGIVELLLKQGADINSQDSDGDTALMKAACKCHQGVVQLLLEQGAQIDTTN